MSELSEALDRSRALELAMRVFESGTIEPYEITKYAEKFAKFLGGPEPVDSELHGETPWSYFVDEVNPHSDSAYFRRIKGNDTRTSEFLNGYGPWSSTGEDISREYMAQAGYRGIRFEELPDWVQEIS